MTLKPLSVKQCKRYITAGKAYKKRNKILKWFEYKVYYQIYSILLIPLIGLSLASVIALIGYPVAIIIALLISLSTLTVTGILTKIHYENTNFIFKPQIYERINIIRKNIKTSYNTTVQPYKQELQELNITLNNINSLVLKDYYITDLKLLQALLNSLYKIQTCIYNKHIFSAEECKDYNLLVTLCYNNLLNQKANADLLSTQFYHDVLTNTQPILPSNSTIPLNKNTIKLPVNATPTKY